MTRNGILYELPISAPHMEGSGFSSPRGPVKPVNQNWQDVPLLMTPLAAEAEKAVSGQSVAHREQGGHQAWLTNQVMDLHRKNEELLPTPAVNDMGAAYTPETWDQWTEKMKQAHGNGNGHGKSLNIEALRMLPTPSANVGMNGGSQHPDKRRAGGHQPSIKDVVEHLLPTPTSERPDGRKSDAFREGRTNFFDVIEKDLWGEYGPAIARWEALSGRPAPAPTLPTGRDGKHQLSAAFVEWMMGLPAGWVTGDIVPVWCKNLEERKAGKYPRPVGMRGSILRFVPITRNAQLKALGNGVVPQQAAEALRRTLDPHRVFFIA